MKTQSTLSNIQKEHTDLGSNDSKIKETESKSTNISNKQDVIIQRFSSILYELSQLKTHISGIQQEIKETEKIIKKDMNMAIRIQKKKEATGKKRSGFAVPTKISKELAIFMKKKPEETMVARTEVTKFIISYIKSNNLQDNTNGQNINADKNLSILLGLKENDTLSYFNIQKYMNRHFIKT